MPEVKSSAIAVVTVHGTGDTAPRAVGDKWFQRGSKFSEGLKRRLADQGVQAEIVPHLWTGANSAWDRERGAAKLASLIRNLKTRYAGVHVVGHSHGGNVANDAAVMLNWGLPRFGGTLGARDDKLIDSMTTVGTPFFDSRTSMMQMIAGVIFVAIAWCGIALLGFACVIFASFLYDLVTNLSEPNISVRFQWGHPLGVGGVSAASDRNAAILTEYVVNPFLPLWLTGTILSVIFMVGIAHQGLRRIFRPTPARTRGSIFAIMHQNDEAIAFLQKVEAVQLEPFPPGALIRGSRTNAIAWGVLVVFLLCALAPLLYALGVDIFLLRTSPQAPIPSPWMGLMVAMGVAPVVFTVVYLTRHQLLGSAIEVGARPRLNRFVVNVLKGLAFGRDGDQVLCNIGTCSHTYATHEYVLRGDCAARMQANASQTATKLLERYRWALFTVGETTNQSLNDLAHDTMTWDSLIHTTYFDQPEVVELIGDYIARRARERGRVGAPAASDTATARPAFARVNAPPAAEGAA